MTVGFYCNREVVIVSRDTAVGEVAVIMRHQHVGDVVVVEERGGKRYPVGIVTDRDLVLEVMAQGLGLGQVTAGDLVTESLIVVEESASLDEALTRMRTHGVRRLPVVDVTGMLVGVLAMDDVVGILADQVGDLALLTERQQRHERARRV